MAFFIIFLFFWPLCPQRKYLFFSKTRLIEKKNPKSSQKNLIICVCMCRVLSFYIFYKLSFFLRSFGQVFFSVNCVFAFLVR